MSSAPTLTSTLPSSLSLPPTKFLSSLPHITHLMASAMVFRTTSTLYYPQILLLRRHPSDSYPSKWEPAGGSTSDGEDASVIAGAVRELWEETGLHAKTVLYPVGMIDDEEWRRLGDADADGPLPIPMGQLGISPEDEMAKNEGDDARTVSFLESGTTWGKVTLVVDVHEDLADEAAVKIRDGEHDRFAWVTEEEVQKGKWEKDGGDIEFTSHGVWRTILEGFRLQREKESQRLMRKFPGQVVKGNFE
ncbi:hypothetical protein QQS21_009748 [Conoideocrella luteorostrata]|uniref:Nudix hydrolase domain-containing protein n=1 Tax=Conoideocrella luteorostrata TaxID=1105319 RepID=A0AAJ0CGD3_9HYPO|nr:hypothetical protein QQS21_009748 [Conoideocrella luteorostrata]